MKRLLKFLSVAVAMLMLITACNGGTQNGDNNGGNGGNNGTEEELKFPAIVENEGEAVDGATLKVGLVLDSPFKGVFNVAWYSGNDDGEIMKYTMFGAFGTDENFRIKDGKGANLELDRAGKKALIKIHPDYTWHDGTPVTAKDFEFYYYIIAHKDYTGVRYDSDFQNVVEIENYHAGKTDTISGLKIIDDKTLEVSFKEMSPSILWSSGIPNEPVPYHQLKDIPVNKMLESDAIRKNPLSAGPYYITEVVPGEKVLFKANEYYYKGVPKIKDVVMEVVNTDTVVEAVKAGKYDLLVGTAVADKYEQLKELTNVKLVGRHELSYNYMGFKLGKWDSAKGEAVTDPTMKMSDPNLRKAMGHALNMEQIGEKLYFGLRGQANSLIIPAFKSFYVDREDAITYDMEKANALLDEAGYKDVDGDGFRENPKGEKLQISVATMAGGDIGDSLAQFYIQSWQEIGLDAVLLTGRPIEFNAFYEKVQADDPGIDVYMAAWGTGTNPEPSGLYGRTAQFNFSRFASEELDKILSDINSEKAFDDAFLKEAYEKYQTYMIEHAPVIPLLFRYEIRPVNNRVKYFDYSHDNTTDWAEIELVAAEPIK